MEAFKINQTKESFESLKQGINPSDIVMNMTRNFYK